jgi:hypothetical protein
VWDDFALRLAAVNSVTDQPMRRIARWADLPEHSHSLLNSFRRSAAAGQGRARPPDHRGGLGDLLHQWDELAEWLRAEASDLHDADAVERAAIGWERSGRHDDWLLDGARLAGAETFSARPGFGARLNPAGEFLLASRRRVNEKLGEREGRGGSPRALAAGGAYGCWRRCWL